jgi:hypothetical protein
MKFAQTYHFAGEWLAKTQQHQQQQVSQRSPTAAPRGNGASLTSPERALHPPAPFSPASSAPPLQLSAPVQRRGLWKRNTTAASAAAASTATAASAAAASTATAASAASTAAVPRSKAAEGSGIGVSPTVSCAASIARCVCTLRLL